MWVGTCEGMGLSREPGHIPLVHGPMGYLSLCLHPTLPAGTESFLRTSSFQAIRTQGNGQSFLLTFPSLIIQGLVYFPEKNHKTLLVTINIYNLQERVNKAPLSSLFARVIFISFSVDALGVINISFSCCSSKKTDTFDSTAQKTKRNPVGQIPLVSRSTVAAWEGI